MPRYGRDFGRGMRGGMSRGGMRYGSEYGGYGGATGWGMGGGTNRGYGGPGGGFGGGPFRGRGQAYDSYFRRDFMTNQGDFTSEFGGGEDYGYRGMNRGGMRGGRFGGMERSFGPQGGFGRGREEDRTSYGEGYGSRWETTHPADIARRNFER